MNGNGGAAIKSRKSTLFGPTRGLVFASAFLLLLVVPGVALTAAGAPTWYVGPGCAYAVIIFSVYRILGIGVGGRKLPTITIFWIFVYVFFGVCALAQVSAGSYPWGGQYSDGTVLKAFGIIAFGIIAFDLGTRKPLARQRPEAHHGGAFRQARLWALIPLVLSFTAFSVIKLGGVAAIFQSRADFGESIGETLNSPEASFIRHMGNTPVYVVFLMVLILRISWGRRGRAWQLIALLVLAGATVVVNNPISTPRFQVGGILLGTVLVLPWSRTRNLWIALGLAVATLVIFPAADVYRSTSKVGAVDFAENFGSVSDTLTRNADFDAFQQIMNGLIVESEEGPRLGMQLVGALAFWVPRDSWRNKPLPTGEYIAAARGYRYQNLSAPMWAEFYVDGGWIGLIFGFYLIGLAAAKLDNACDVAREPRAQPLQALALCSVVIAGYEFYILRGSLMPAVAYITPAILTIAVAFAPRLTFRASHG